MRARTHTLTYTYVCVGARDCTRACVCEYLLLKALNQFYVSILHENLIKQS